MAATLDDAGSLPKSLQPLAPLAPILRSALAPQGGMAGAAAAATGTEPVEALGANATAAEAGAMVTSLADGAQFGSGSWQGAPKRLPAVTALLLAEVCVSSPPQPTTSPDQP